MTLFRALLLGSLVLGQASLAQATPSPSLQGLDENEPQVQAFYRMSCSNMADAQQHRGEARNSFMQTCLADAPAIWPVGFDESED